MNGSPKNRRSSLSSLIPFHHIEEGIIHCKDEIEICSRLSFKVKPQCLGYKSHSFIFEKNVETGVVDLTYCSRKPFGKREIKIFKNCTHFGIADPTAEEKVLELTTESCETSFFLHCSFKLSFDHEVYIYIYIYMSIYLYIYIYAYILINFVMGLK
jgi:hypothetical protein